MDTTVANTIQDFENVKVFIFSGESIEEVESIMHQHCSFQYDKFDGISYVSILKDEEFDGNDKLVRLEV